MLTPAKPRQVHDMIRNASEQSRSCCFRGVACFMRDEMYVSACCDVFCHHNMTGYDIRIQVGYQNRDKIHKNTVEFSYDSVDCLAKKIRQKRERD